MADVGTCVRCAPRPPGAVHGGRPAAVSDVPRAAVPKRGPEPPQDHEEGAIQEEAAVTPGRLGAAVSRSAEFLALSRAIVFFHRLGMTLMSRHHIDFVTFDFAAEGLHGLPLDDPFAELSGHLLGVIGIEI